MGQRLSQYFLEAEKIGAANARMRLVMLAHITTSQAAAIPDTSEEIEKFEAIMKRLRAEYESTKN